MRKFVLALALCGVLSEGVAFTADDDPIKTTLTKAKVAYEATQEAYREAVGKYFDKREDIARADGNKKLVDQIKEERATFESRGELPRTAPVELKNKLLAARQSLTAAYTIAIRDYTKAKNDDKANAIEKELENLKRNSDAAWVDLFNGKDLKGWHSSEGGQTLWRIQNGVLTGSGRAGWLITDRSDFRDYRLRIEALLGPGDDSGVCVRVQDQRCHLAYEIQIGTNDVGSVYLFQWPKQPITLLGAKGGPPVGKWVTLEILVAGSKFTVWVDGKLIGEGEDREKRYQGGAIGVQHFSPKSTMSFRKIEIKEFTTSAVNK